MTKILKREANYPITIPAKVRFDLRLTANEKLLYGAVWQELLRFLTNA